MNNIHVCNTTESIYDLVVLRLLHGNGHGL